MQYCQIPESLTFVTFELDHIVAVQHGGVTTDVNLALTCLPCNKRKGPNLSSLDPATGALTPLFNPRTGNWPDHFKLNQDGFITGLTPAGRATVRLLELNIADRLEERRVFIAAGALVPTGD